MKKYKTNNLFVDGEQNNSYIVIDESANKNLATLVDESTEQNEKKNENGDALTISSAMDKYFYPKANKFDEYVKKINDIYKKIDSELPQKPKRKRVPLRIILQSISSLGIGSVCALLFAYFMGSTFLRPILIFGGICTVVSGAIIGLTDHLIYRRKVKKQNEQIKLHNKKLIDLIQWDNKYIITFVSNAELFKSQVNMEKFLLSSALNETQMSVATFNQTIFKIVKRIYNYDFRKDEAIANLIAKYEKLCDCYADTNSILADFDFLKKNLPTLSVIVPETIAQKDRDVVYSLRCEEAKFLTKTLIPFAQVFNVTYGKVYQNYLEEKQKEEEKERQEKLRVQEEERKRVEREQEEAKLRKELKQKEFEKENKQYKEFFDEYGIDEELDQEEQTK